MSSSSSALPPSASNDGESSSSASNIADTTANTKSKKSSSKVNDRKEKRDKKRKKSNKEGSNMKVKKNENKSRERSNKNGYDNKNEISQSQFTGNNENDRNLSRSRSRSRSRDPKRSSLPQRTASRSNQTSTNINTQSHQNRQQFPSRDPSRRPLRPQTQSSARRTSYSRYESSDSEDIPCNNNGEDWPYDSRSEGECENQYQDDDEQDEEDGQVQLDDDDEQDEQELDDNQEFFMERDSFAGRIQQRSSGKKRYQQFKETDGYGSPPGIKNQQSSRQQRNDDIRSCESKYFIDDHRELDYDENEQGQGQDQGQEQEFGQAEMQSLSQGFQEDEIQNYTDNQNEIEKGSGNIGQNQMCDVDPEQDIKVKEPSLPNSEWNQSEQSESTCTSSCKIASTTSSTAIAYQNGKPTLAFSTIQNQNSTKIQNENSIKIKAVTIAKAQAPPPPMPTPPSPKPEQEYVPSWRENNGKLLTPHDEEKLKADKWYLRQCGLLDPSENGSERKSEFDESESDGDGDAILDMDWEDSESGSAATGEEEEDSSLNLSAGGEEEGEILGDTAGDSNASSSSIQLQVDQQVDVEIPNTTNNNMEVDEAENEDLLPPQQVNKVQANVNPNPKSDSKELGPAPRKISNVRNRIGMEPKVKPSKTFPGEDDINIISNVEEDEKDSGLDQSFSMPSMSKKSKSWKKQKDFKVGKESMEELFGDVIQQDNDMNMNNNQQQQNFSKSQWSMKMEKNRHLQGSKDSEVNKEGFFDAELDDNDQNSDGDVQMGIVLEDDQIQEDRSSRLEMQKQKKEVQEEIEFNKAITSHENKQRLLDATQQILINHQSQGTQLTKAMLKEIIPSAVIRKYDPKMSVNHNQLPNLPKLPGNGTGISTNGHGLNNGNGIDTTLSSWSTEYNSDFSCDTRTQVITPSNLPFIGWKSNTDGKSQSIFAVDQSTSSYNQQNQQHQQLQQAQQQAQQQNQSATDPKFIQKALNRATIRKMARRGGCKRVASTVYEPIQQSGVQWVDQVVDDLFVNTGMASSSSSSGFSSQVRKTVKTMDIVRAVRKVTSGTSGGSVGGGVGGGRQITILGYGGGGGSSKRG